MVILPGEAGVTSGRTAADPATPLPSIIRSKHRSVSGRCVRLNASGDRRGFSKCLCKKHLRLASLCRLSGLYLKRPSGQNTASVGDLFHCPRVCETQQRRRISHQPFVAAVPVKKRVQVGCGALGRARGAGSRKTDCNSKGVLKVTKFSFCAALAAVVLCSTLVSVAPSQQRDPNRYMPPAQPVAVAPRTMAPIALLDVGRIFENHSRLQRAKEQLQGDVQQFKNFVKSERDAIRKLAEQLKLYRPGSPEYKQLDEQITTRQADLQVKVRLKDKQLTQQQAAILHDVYKEIQQEVESIAAARGFVMVLRFDGAPVNRDQPSEVSRDISKQVVWLDKQADITDEVLARLERRAQYGNRGTTNSHSRPGIPPRPTHR